MLELFLLEIVVEKKKGIKGGTRKKRWCSRVVFSSFFLLFFDFLTHKNYINTHQHIKIQ
jgi:hypothetical protein